MSAFPKKITRLKTQTLPKLGGPGPLDATADPSSPVFFEAMGLPVPFPSLPTRDDGLRQADNLDPQRHVRPHRPAPKKSEKRCQSRVSRASSADPSRIVFLDAKSQGTDIVDDFSIFNVDPVRTAYLESLSKKGFRDETGATKSQVDRTEVILQRKLQRLSWTAGEDGERPRFEKGLGTKCISKLVPKPSHSVNKNGEYTETSSSGMIEVMYSEPDETIRGPRTLKEAVYSKPRLYDADGNLIGGDDPYVSFGNMIVCKSFWDYSYGPIRQYQVAQGIRWQLMHRLFQGGSYLFFTLTLPHLLEYFPTPMEQFLFVRTAYRILTRYKAWEEYQEKRMIGVIRRVYELTFDSLFFDYKFGSYKLSPSGMHAHIHGLLGAIGVVSEATAAEIERQLNRYWISAAKQAGHELLGKDVDVISDTTARYMRKRAVDVRLYAYKPGSYSGKNIEAQAKEAHFKRVKETAERWKRRELDIPEQLMDFADIAEKKWTSMPDETGRHHWGGSHEHFIRQLSGIGSVSTYMGGEHPVKVQYGIGQELGMGFAKTGKRPRRVTLQQFGAQLSMIDREKTPGAYEYATKVLGGYDPDQYWHDINLACVRVRYSTAPRGWDDELEGRTQLRINDWNVTLPSDLRKIRSVKHVSALTDKEFAIDRFLRQKMVPQKIRGSRQSFKSLALGNEIYLAIVSYGRRRFAGEMLEKLNAYMKEKDIKHPSNADLEYVFDLTLANIPGLLSEKREFRIYKRIIESPEWDANFWQFYSDGDIKAFCRSLHGFIGERADFYAQDGDSGFAAELLQARLGFCVYVRNELLALQEKQGGKLPVEAFESVFKDTFKESCPALKDKLIIPEYFFGSQCWTPMFDKAAQHNRRRSLDKLRLVFENSEADFNRIMDGFYARNPDCGYELGDELYQRSEDEFRAFDLSGLGEFIDAEWDAWAHEKVVRGSDMGYYMSPLEDEIVEEDNRDYLEELREKYRKYMVFAGVVPECENFGKIFRKRVRSDHPWEKPEDYYARLHEILNPDEDWEGVKRQIAEEEYLSRFSGMIRKYGITELEDLDLDSLDYYSLERFEFSEQRLNEIFGWDEKLKLEFKKLLPRRSMGGIPVPALEAADICVNLDRIEATDKAIVKYRENLSGSWDRLFNAWLPLARLSFIAGRICEPLIQEYRERRNTLFGIDGTVRLPELVRKYLLSCFGLGEDGIDYHGRFVKTWEKWSGTWLHMAGVSIVASLVCAELLRRYDSEWDEFLKFPKLTWKYQRECFDKRLLGKLGWAVKSCPVLSAVILPVMWMVFLAETGVSRELVEERVVVKPVEVAGFDDSLCAGFRRTGMEIKRGALRKSPVVGRAA